MVNPEVLVFLLLLASRNRSYKYQQEKFKCYANTIFNYFSLSPISLFAFIHTFPSETIMYHVFILHFIYNSTIFLKFHVEMTQMSWIETMFSFRNITCIPRVLSSHDIKIFKTRESLTADKLLVMEIRLYSSYEIFRKMKSCKRPLANFSFW